MSDQLVTVAEYETAFEAELTKNNLQDNGIKAIVVGENLASVMTQIESIVSVEVKVMQADAEKARAVIEAHKKQCQEAADAQADCGCDCTTEMNGDCDCDCDCDCREDE